MNHPRLTARIAGLLYLVVVITSTFALITISGLTVSGDPAATGANILAGETMFRLGVAATLIAAVAYTAVVALLYWLLKPVNPALAVVNAFIGLAGCASSATFLVHQLAVIGMLGAEGSAFSPEQTQILMQQSLRLGALGNSLSLVFFGSYCLTLGWLVFGARFLPRVLGLFLVIAGVGWLVGNLGYIIAPEMFGPISRILLPMSGLGELLFTLWILIMGVNEAKWREQAGA